MRSCTAALLAVLTAPLASQSELRTNLVTIVTDDQGRWAMGCYGNDEIHTPNTDRIAREGALFFNATVATPVCSPSRATWLTGRYPTELGITDWIAPHQAAEGLGLTAPTWPQALQAAGYRTALFGKWHLGEQPEFHPTRLGFDEFAGFLDGGNRPMNATLEVDGESKRVDGPLPDRLTDFALAFLRQHRDRPFALSLHFRAPHLPYGPVPEQDREPYADLDPTIPDFAGLDTDKVKRSTKAYYASITSIDRNVGRLLDALDELGLADRTIVWFTSDHGYNEGRHGVNTKGNGHWIVGGRSGPKRPNMWETSITIPMAVRWPGTIPPGTRIDTPISTVDTYRTVLGMLDVPLPDAATPHGHDLAPHLLGGPAPDRPALFGQYDLHNNGLAYLRMIRTDRYKLVRHLHADFMDELYDLREDPGETRNLIRGRPRAAFRHEIAKPLNDRLVAWMRSIDDPLAELADRPLR